MNKKFISYKDDDETIRSGKFLILSETQAYIKFESGKNIITLPWGRIIKIKEEKINNCKEVNT